MRKPPCQVNSLDVQHSLTEAYHRQVWIISYRENQARGGVRTIDVRRLSGVGAGALDERREDE